MVDTVVVLFYELFFYRHRYQAKHHSVNIMIQRCTIHKTNA